MGRAADKNVTEKDVDPKELKMGIEIEMEHTDNKVKAKKIALDHLAELPDYYTRLKAMEKKGEKEKNEGFSDFNQARKQDTKNTLKAKRKIAAKKKKRNKMKSFKEHLAEGRIHSFGTFGE
jgi:hypothetical protein